MGNPTVLDAQAQGRVIYVTGNVSPTIEGLRLTNGNPQAAMDESTCTAWWDCETVGAAVYAWQANLTLNDSQIDNNYFGRFDGGSIYINSGHANLTHNMVMSNVNGGGIALLNSSGVISGNLIISNSVYGDGGGVLVKFGSATLINNTIISNTAHYVCGGGVCIGYGSAVLDNNTIRGNSILAGREVVSISSPAPQCCEIILSKIITRAIFSISTVEALALSSTAAPILSAISFGTTLPQPAEPRVAGFTFTPTARRL